ncbi:bestrophin family protein [Ferruginibacter yonginensis]|uniref:Bestrophin family protein n=1 Tax=Ferruginibacter yonginensis TaxID=1310416 RepID=A0ABV8QSX6_9BACT
MVPYNQKNPFSYVFKFHKADTFRKLLPFIVLFCLYAWAVAYLVKEYYHLPDSSPLHKVTLMHALLGFAISTLLVFRTNTAYDRWWEGRKLWGALVNNSRNLAMKLNAILPENMVEDRTFFSKVIPAFALVLHDHLHKENTRTELFEDAQHGHIFNEIDEDKHIPNQVGAIIYKRVQKLLAQKVITGEQLLFINAELQSLADICGACERIKNTPIPFSYSVFIKKFIFIYVATLPFGYVFDLGYLVIPVTAFILYVLASLELIAEEIEDPFGGDQNDVPTDKIAANIQKNVADIL